MSNIVSLTDWQQKKYNELRAEFQNWLNSLGEQELADYCDFADNCEWDTELPHTL